ncbi:hypothetical protein [Paenibacillus agricola]|uniref:hypothetical protein n=1 Tax=Paenibacillus agricola TaxID=2716264 RepID=UPI001A9F2E13|nr:hypothetical protein [Paenibacillus agricola]
MNLFQDPIIIPRHWRKRPLLTEPILGALPILLVFCWYTRFRKNILSKGMVLGSVKV